MLFDRQDLKKYMERCIDLAKQRPPGIRKPYVGAVVISNDGGIISEGYKSFVRSTNLLYHAERMALDNARGDIARSILITSLEPCINIKEDQLFKSCCDLLIERGIETVVIGLADSSPSVHDGMGINYLRSHGIKTTYYRNLSSIIEKELIRPGYVVR